MKFKSGLDGRILDCIKHPVLLNVDGIVTCAICKEKLGRVKDSTWASRDHEVIIRAAKLEKGRNANLKEIIE